MTKQHREKNTARCTRTEKNKGHGSTFLKHVFNTGRDTAQKRTNKRLRSNSDRRFKHTAEVLKTCQTHQRVDVLHTDHKHVAVFREKIRIFTHRNKRDTLRCGACWCASCNAEWNFSHKARLVPRPTEPKSDVDQSTVSRSQPNSELDLPKSGTSSQQISMSFSATWQLREQGTEQHPRPTITTFFL